MRLICHSSSFGFFLTRYSCCSTSRDDRAAAVTAMLASRAAGPVEAARKAEVRLCTASAGSGDLLGGRLAAQQPADASQV